MQSILVLVKIILMKYLANRSCSQLKLHSYYQQIPIFIYNSFIKILKIMSKFQAKKAKLKKQDFQFNSGWFEEVIKLPGTMHQQQFQVSDCEDSSLFIFDPSACVYIDDCKYCYFFIAPCEASIFIRNCNRCTIICCTRQFRTRDCNDCNIALWCQSQPVIQNSFGIKFSCFPNWGYELLEQQFKKIKFSVWNNNWFDIYDFTKKSISNYRLTEFDNKVLKQQKFIEALKKSSLKFVQNIVPKVCGINLEVVFKGIIFTIDSSQKQSFRRCKYKLYKSRNSIINESDGLSLGLSKGLYIFLEFSSQDKKGVSQYLNKLNIKVIKVFENLDSSLYNLIFVPFKDQH